MILIVNAGSSSLKVALYRRRPRLEPDVTATIDRLGHVRMNHKATIVFRGGVTLQHYEPVSVEE